MAISRSVLKRRMYECGGISPDDEENEAVVELLDALEEAEVKLKRYDKGFASARVLAVAVRQIQAVMAAYLPPDSTVPEKEVISAVLLFTDNRHVIESLTFWPDAGSGIALCPACGRDPWKCDCPDPLAVLAGAVRAVFAATSDSMPPDNIMKHLCTQEVGEALRRVPEAWPLVTPEKPRTLDSLEK